MIEAIVVVSIMSVAFAAIISAALFSVKGGLGITDETQAVFLLDESVEAVRFMRDGGFSTNITPLVGVGAQYLEPATSSWVATTTNTLIFGQFSRTVEFSEVYRNNADGSIVPSTSGDPKTLDPGTVRVDVVISWANGSRNATTYLTDLYEN